MSPACLIDGAPADAIAVDSRGLAYGDGVFRTLLVDAGAPLHLDDHFAALQRDAARLDLEVPEASLWQHESQCLSEHQQRAVLKWLLIRRGGRRGYRADTRACHRIVQRVSAPAAVAAAARVRVAQLQLAVQPALAGIKHLNRLEQVLAARELDDGVDELLMCDHGGHLVGGLRSNLFWVQDGLLLTPMLDRCGVVGTMRQRVRRLAATLGVECREVRASAAVLASCDEGFVTNAVLGIWPLRQIGDRSLTAPGPLTRRLQHELRHPSAF